VTSPNREKRRRIILLRSVLLLAVGGLLLASVRGTPGFVAVGVLALFAISNLALLAVPLRVVASLRFELLVGAADLLLVATGFYLAGASRGVLPVSCLLMVLVVALGNYRAHTVAGAAVVGALHAWLVLGNESSAAEVGGLAVQVAFLCAVALYYGFLVGGIHRERRRAEAERLERRELITLLQILEKISSSLELRDVARAIVQKITHVIPALRCSILLVDEARTHGFVMASHDAPELDMLKIELDKYPEICRAIETRDPVLIQDVATDPLMAGVRHALEELDFHSIMVVPLTFGDDVLGTLCLKTARAGQEFRSNEVDFFHAVARASSNALKNALLHHKVCEQSQQYRKVGEQLASVLDNSPGLILATDNQGRIAEFNRGAELLLGHRKAEIIGRPYKVLLEQDDAGDLLSRVRDAARLANVELRLRCRDGSTRELQLNMAVLRSEGGEATGTVWLGRDVTELKSAQLQLLQAEKLSTIGEVISGVAHELNNPLSGVLGYAQLLLMRHSGSPLARDLEKINESAARCQKIVRDLLAFARGHKPERKYLGVNGILRKTLDIRRYQLNVNDVEVLCELEEDLPRTMLDYYQLQQVFLNLINNAQHAMASTGRRGRLSVRTAQRDGKLRIEIGDNGGGMDRATLERIFDPFFTTKEQGQGTGLGLSVSYGIVREHGGTIRVESEPGRGTTFFIELPVHGSGDDAGAAEREGDAGEAPPARRDGRVLVVDDEPMIVDLLLSVLDEAGYHVDTAANGEEAARKIEQRPYDVLITDVRMPRMNGMELYRRLQASRPEMQGRVLFITGDLIDERTTAFLTEIGARTLPKPIDLAELTAAVAEIARPDPAGSTARAAHS
jgi:PAS domain S-box-containing protein